MIDCVDIEAQPALRHAADKRLATPPPFQVQLHPSQSPKLEELAGTEVLLQRGVRNGAGVEMACPEGTVPVRQIGAADLARFGSLHQMMQKHHDGRGGLPVGQLERRSPDAIPGFGPVGGSGGGLQTLEGGVQKYVDLYGDSNPHLFIYSTSDDYQSQGCYNAAGVANGGNVIEFGGEIIDDRSQRSYHTFTQMGSGQFPAAWYTHAAYQRNIFYWDPSGNAYWATGLNAYRTDADCYDIAKYDNDANWHTYFFYGGPGYNTNCQ